MSADPLAMPLVGVCDRYAVGANNLDDSAPYLECVLLDEALAREWDFDAHFVTYSIKGQEQWTRCNQTILGQLRQQGDDMLTSCFAFDWDTVGHVELTPELYRDMVAKLRTAISAELSLAGDWTAVYTTKNGMRLLYVLKTPIPVDTAKPYMRAIVRDFSHHGIELDELYDWNRLMRLPRVMRAGEPSWKGKLFECLIQTDKTLDVDDLLGIDMGPAHEPLRETFEQADIHRPDVAGARDCLYDVSKISGKRIMTDWLKTAKRMLTGRDCFDTIFENGDFGQQGERHMTIYKYVGQATRLLYANGATPELIYALFVDAGLRIDLETVAKDPFEVIWGAVEHCWSREAARQRQEDADRAAAQATKESTMLGVLMGMRGWCDHPALYGNDKDALDWIQRRLILCHGKVRYVMQRDGYYCSTPVSKDILNVLVRQLGMGEVIPALKPDDLVVMYGIVVNSVVGVTNIKGCFVEDFGAKHITLRKRLFGLREDLVPTYSAEADTWVHWLAGETDYQRLCDWIGLSLDFSRPICALSLAGAPSVGKGLLVQGLAECVDTRSSFATGSEFGAFQSNLMNTPFLVINEGFPERASGSKDPAEKFRELVDGMPLEIRQLYQPPITIHNPLRVIFCANNEGVIEMLAGRKDLSPDDQKGLAMRLFHMTVTEDAATYLRDLGGMEHTAREGHRWITGHAGQPSDHVLAKHFLWLHKRRPAVPPGARLLMEGNLGADIMERLSTQSGSAPEVIECLIRMIESESAHLHGISIEGAAVRVTNASVVQFHRTTIAPKSHQRLTNKSVGNTIKSLTHEDAHLDPLQSLRNGLRGRWMRLNIQRLCKYAIENGYASNTLVRLVEQETLDKIGLKNDAKNAE